MRAVALLLLLVLLPSLARAELPAIPPGDDKISPLAAGEKAPFGGQLYDTPTALRWANWLEQYRLHLKSDVEEQRALGQIQFDLVNKKLELERAQYQTVTGAYQKQVAGLQEELRNPPWYKTPWFGFTLGVVGSVLLIGTTAWVIHETK